MKNYEFKNKEDFSEFLEEKHEDFYKTIWKSIDEAYTAGRKSAYIAEVFLNEEKAFIDMVSEEDQWIGSLTHAMNFYSNNEEYEICTEIKKLIEKIRNRTNS
jgi:excinuclease UvrABC helicase subunit UvrB